MQMPADTQQQTFKRFAIQYTDRNTRTEMGKVGPRHVPQLVSKEYSRGCIDSPAKCQAQHKKTSKRSS